MLLHKFSTRRAVRTRSIDFGLLSDEEVRRLSVVEVNNLSIYHRGVPQAHAINDARMGPVDRRIICSSCGKDMRSCVGHCGHIELGAPVFQIAFIENTMRCLRSTCYFCSRILVSEADALNILRETPAGKLSFNAVYSAARTKRKCPHCEGPQPTYSRSATLGIKIEWPLDTDWRDEEEKKDVTARVFTSVEAHSILSNMLDRDVALLGLSPTRAHPKSTVRETCLVPPPISRPCIMASSGSRVRGEDDITHALQQVLKRSLEFKQYISTVGWDRTEPMTEAIHDKLLKLQIECFSLVNNSVRGQRQATVRSGMPQKSIASKLKGKDGRIRGNLMGKRVDFSARAVITPDSCMSVEEVGVPLSVALELSVPVKCTINNLAEMRERVLIGAKDIRGASSVITCDGQVTFLEFCEDRRSIRLQPGWTVERPLQNGDWVIFNRQPSLWKFGMLAHRVKIVPHNTFRLNLCLCGPYNADFDGDEMNLHVCQTELAQAETRGLMACPLLMISPQSKPVFGIVQDTLLGCAKMTTDGAWLTRKQFFRFLMWARYPVKPLVIPPAAVTYPVELWTGSQLFGMLLPTSVTVLRGRHPEPTEVPQKNDVFIRAGRLLYGRMTKAMLGTASNSLIDVLVRDFGCQLTIRFCTDVQRITKEYLMLVGFNVRTSDCVMSAEGHAEVNRVITNAVDNASAIVNSDLPESLAAVGEGTVSGILSKLLVQTGEVARQYTDPDSALIAMVDVGSKGSIINISQVLGCVGQQSVEGKRIASISGGRVLNCFHSDDKRLVTRGFVVNSYALGLSPEEFLFHAMSGREGLVDTAVKTSVTGYLQRRLVKLMEDFKVCYRGTIRGGGNRVIDFSYGGDGTDPSRLEKFQLQALTMNESELKKQVFDGEGNAAVQQREYNLIRLLTLRTRNARLGGGAITLDCMSLIPFSPRRLMQTARDTDEGDPIDEAAVVRTLEGLATHLVNGLRPRVTTALAIQFCFRTSALRTMRVGMGAFRRLFELCERKCRECLVHPGDMVGTVAAQSIGEPATQMSCSYSTRVLVAIDDKSVSTSIGALIDSYLPPIASDDQHDVLPVANLRCTGVSPKEHVVWTNVTHVSRHPANGDMLTVTTKRGRTLKMTASHSFLVRDTNRVVQRRGSDLELGDCLPIVKNMPSNDGHVPDAPMPLTRATGRYIGAIVSAGTVNENTIVFDNTEFDWATGIMEDFGRATCFDVRLARRKTLRLGSLPVFRATVNSRTLASWVEEHFGRTSFNKTLPGWILDAPDEFVSGLLQTYFDGGGNVQTDAGHHRLCCHSVSEQLILMLCLCLARYGIVACVGSEAYKTPAGRPCTIHRLTIPLCYAGRFQKHIGLSIKHKVEKLAEIVRHQALQKTRDFQAHIPGMNEVLEELRESVPPGGDKNGVGTLLRKELRRLQRKAGVMPQMLVRCREHAVKYNAPAHLLDELDQAIHADVWWDPIVSIEVEQGSTEMVYDFTVQEELQSFMLSNGVFVHNTLNTFHYAGVAAKSNTCSGIPRLKEILDCARKCRTPSNTLFLKHPYNKSAEFASNFAQTLSTVRLASLVKRTEVVFDPDFHRTLIEEDKDMVRLDSYFFTPPAGAARWVGRLILSKADVKAHLLTPPVLCEQLSQRMRDKASFTCSENNALEWVMRIRLHDISTMAKRGFNDDECDDIEQILVQRIVSSLLDQVHTFGHPGVQSARSRSIERWSTENEAVETTHAVETLGTLLGDAALIDAVDWYSCTSNDVHEVLEVLGIEACCHIILSEIASVIGFDGTYVDRKHLLNVANGMTSTGELRPVSRHGLNKPGPCGAGAGPLMRCSFEETPEVLTEAGLYAEIDDTFGVSSSVMSGERAFIGSGYFDVIYAANELPSDIREVRKSKLAKSKVRCSIVAEEKRAVEFMKDTLWSFRGSDACVQDAAPGVMEAPFSMSDDMSGVVATGSAVYAEPPKSSISHGKVFVPSSPPQLL